MVKVFARGNDLEIWTSYKPEFVAELKTAVPYSSRKYNPVNKTWMVAGSFSGAVKQMLDRHFGGDVQMPAMNPAASVISVLEILYVGSVKERADGSASASGWENDGWNVLFPLDVLRGFFEPNVAKDKPSSGNLYSTLSITRGATPEEIKRGYRRMAMQWHPDRYNEPDAADIFHKIQHAYDVLSNAKTKARYDAGLQLEAAYMQKQKKAEKLTNNMNANSYRAPLRSGLLLCSYTERAKRKTIEKILSWQDIIRADGKTLVSSWPMGADAPRVEWV